MKKWLVPIILVLFSAIAPNSSLPVDSRDSEKKEKKAEPKDLFRPHEEIVVTATATRKAVKDCSASVSVVKAEDIQAVPASNALNLLGFLPGIFVQRTGDFGRADIEIRGIGQNGRRINILVDGRPEKMGLFGCAVTHTFPLDNVERIEVVRGPASVLYGSEALGGVVNIITHSPEEGFETDFSASYGSFRTRQLNLRHGGKLGRWSYYFTLDDRQSDGHLPHSDYHGKAFTGKLIYDFTDNLHLVFQGKYFRGKKSEYGPVNFPLSNFWNDYERGSGDLTLKGGGERKEFFFKIYEDFGHHLFSDGWHSRDYVQGGIFRYTSRLIPRNELTMGGDFRILSGKSYNSPQGKWEKSEAAVFVQDEYVFHDRWILSAGFRLHRDSLFGLEWCPHVGAVFKLDEKTTFRASVNKGFRSPQLNELYIFPASNRDLKPERVWGYEAGFQRQIGKQASFGVTVYRLHGSNLIETALNPSPPPKFKFSNVGKFTFKGAEFNFEAAFSPSFSTLLFYTYLDPGEKTKGRPGQKLDLSLRWEKKFFFAALQAQYITDYYADDFSRFRLSPYFLLNSRFEAKLFSFFSLFCEINNILNKDYQIYVDMPGIATGIYAMPRRSFNVGLRITA
ncbi:MAG: TonB-dependent receptor plug domain-containing protein [Candidatus Aminicenantales bacterium]